ncbi:MAG: biopolymer transport protein ExbD [Marinomonas primoryensis]|jgi:biopolymer transport protein ExbD
MSVLPKQRNSSSDDNMIPLINIVFLLLIFFMVAGHIQKRPNASIELPTLTHLETPANLQRFVEINADGMVSMDEKAMTPEQVGDALSVISTSEGMTEKNNAVGELIVGELAPGELTVVELTLVVDQRVTAAQLESVLSELRPLKNIALSILVEDGA